MVLYACNHHFMVFDREVSEAFKNMIEHEMHFNPNLMDEGLSALIMRTIYGGGRYGRKVRIADVWRVEIFMGWCDDGGGGICELPKLFNDLFPGHEGFRMGTKSTMSPIEVGWCKEGFILHLMYGCGEVGGVVNMSSRGARGFPVEEEALVAIIDSVQRGVEIELRRKMRMFEGEDGFPFSKIELHFSELHLERITDNCLTLFGGVLGRGSFIENGITDNEGIIQGSQIDKIWVDAFRKGCNRSISSEHVCSFAWNIKNLRKLVKTKGSLIVPNDEGNGNSLVHI
ncbi:hypothetical protein Tco_0341055 [Tanacetum coccineum]